MTEQVSEITTTVANGDRPGRRERRRAENREKLFQAAMRLFAERGVQRTTVEDITEAADLGKGTFFNYFPTKEHILSVLAETQHRKLALALAAAREGREPLYVIGRRLVLALAAEPGHSQLMARSLVFALVSSEAVRDLMVNAMAEGRLWLAEFFQIAKDRGELRPDADPQQLAWSFQQMFFGTITLWSVNPASDLNQRIVANFDLIWSGLQPHGSPPLAGKNSAPKKASGRRHS
jgi:AcrR family transcriptional regulator